MMRWIEILLSPFVKLADLLARMDDRRRALWEKQGKRSDVYAERQRAKRAAIKAKTQALKQRNKARKDWRRIIKHGKL